MSLWKFIDLETMTQIWYHIYQIIWLVQNDNGCNFHDICVGRFKVLMNFILVWKKLGLPACAWLSKNTTRIFSTIEWKFTNTLKQPTHMSSMFQLLWSSCHPGLVLLFNACKMSKLCRDFSTCKIWPCKIGVNSNYDYLSLKTPYITIHLLTWQPT